MAALMSTERRTWLLNVLSRDGVIRLDDVALELGVSAMTIRRDLLDLEGEGLIRRVRGGAVAPLLPQSFAARKAEQAGPKATIARKAMTLVPQTGAIAVDASSTNAVLLAHLSDFRDLLIATNSVENAAAARRFAGVRSVLIGGELEERTDSFVGSLAARAASALSYRRFFSSAAAIDARGSSEVTPEEAEMKLVFARAADETVLLVDSSKLGGRALADALDWQSVALLITDLEPEDSRLDSVRGLVELL
jgi:DeoR family fructose operon transcriptional repressor